MPQKSLADFDPALKKISTQSKQRSRFKAGSIQASVNLRQTDSSDQNCRTCNDSGYGGYLMGDVTCWHLELIVYNTTQKPEEKWVCDDFRPPEPCDTCERPCPGEDQCQEIQTYWQQWERE